MYGNGLVCRSIVLQMAPQSLFLTYRTNSRTPGQDPDSPLPPIHERLAYLRPSRELLEFYREKIAQFDGEHEELLQMLDKYKGIAEDQVRSHCV